MWTLTAWIGLAVAPFLPFTVVWLATGYASTVLLYSALAMVAIVAVIAALRQLAAGTLR